MKLDRIEHFRLLAERRKQPGNCRRCGKPNANGKAHCDRCRQYMAAYKKRIILEDKAGKVELVKVAATVLQLRRETSALRASFKRLSTSFRKGYRAGYLAGLLKRRARFKNTITKYQDAMPTITEQELATMNHAYINET